MTKPRLWPAHLHHFCLDTPQINVVVPWYETHLELGSGKLADGAVWLSGRQRNIVFRPADEKAFGYVAYALADADQLARLDADLAAKDVARSDIRSPVFADARVSAITARCGAAPCPAPGRHSRAWRRYGSPCSGVLLPAA